MPLHHYTTLHQLIHLAALHHLRNVIPVDTSYSWRYSTIYTTLYQSMHLIPSGIPPFTQRYISQYIFSLTVLHHLHNVTSVNTSFPFPYNSYITLYRSIPALPVQACGRETRCCYVHRILQPQAGDRNRSIPHTKIPCSPGRSSAHRHCLLLQSTPQIVLHRFRASAKRAPERSPRLSHFRGTFVCCC